jgi:hypothetical protein
MRGCLLMTTFSVLSGVQPGSRGSSKAISCWIVLALRERPVQGQRAEEQHSRRRRARICIYSKYSLRVYSRPRGIPNDTTLSSSTARSPRCWLELRCSQLSSLLWTTLAKKIDLYAPSWTSLKPISSVQWLLRCLLARQHVHVNWESKNRSTILPPIPNSHRLQMQMCNNKNGGCEAAMVGIDITCHHK